MWILHDTDRPHLCLLQVLPSRHFHIEEAREEEGHVAEHLDPRLHDGVAHAVAALSSSGEQSHERSHHDVAGDHRHQEQERLEMENGSMGSGQGASNRGTPCI